MSSEESRLRNQQRVGGMVASGLVFVGTVFFAVRWGSGPGGLLMIASTLTLGSALAVVAGAVGQSYVEMIHNAG